MISILKPFIVVTDIVFPRTCVICGKSLFDGSFYLHPYRYKSYRYEICTSCESSFKPISGPRCGKCGRELISEEELCLSCRERERFYHFEQNRAVFSYRGPIKEALYYYKFQNVQNLAWFFAKHIFKIYNQFFQGIPLIPVPSHFWKRRRKGRDHIGVIASYLEAYYDVPVQKILKKGKAPEQKTLSHEERMINLRGRITVKKKENLPSAVVLLDDVFTSGGTISACSEQLLSAGVIYVYSLTLAID